MITFRRRTPGNAARAAALGLAAMACGAHAAPGKQQVPALNAGYDQPPYPSFFLGEGMQPLPPQAPVQPR